MISEPKERARQHLPSFLLLICLALVIVFPLLLHGPSCGHDFGFHLQSWMDASVQMRHGDPLPRWAFSPAFNAGEPRFLFYPPLSWLLGSLLMLALPPNLVPAAFTAIALAGAAIAMYSLALRYSSWAGALLAAAVYVANPYMLFTAFERTAFAELLAAAWMPLLLRAALAEDPTVLGAALPLALLWLTNAPAAVMGTYTFVLLALLRAGLPAGIRAVLPARLRERFPGLQTTFVATRQRLTRAGTGLLLGLALPGFYLVPAALQRRYVQIAMAIIPNMRVEDNFLFGHTGYGPHDAVLHTASLVSLAVITLTAIALLLAFLLAPPWDRGTDREDPASPPSSAPSSMLAILAAVIALLLWHGTLPLWHALPEMAFLQFPWRLLSVLGCVLGLAVALAWGWRQLPLPTVALVGLAWVSVATALTLPSFRQGCDTGELPADRLLRFNTHHGVGPTDEYTPTDADNDQLRWDDPAWWLTADPNAPGPGTIPNPAATILDYDQPPPMERTVSGLAPHHLVLHMARPEDLVLNLRDYPTWTVTLNGTLHPAHLQRDDGLLAIALPTGTDTVDIRWHTLPDMWAGDALSLLALAVAVALRFSSRRIRS